MASPLTMYVQIKQDAASQAAAAASVANFTQGVQANLDTLQIVHYATLTLVPNPSTTPGVPATGYLAILLMTDFDLAMNPYLATFWNDPTSGIKAAVQGIADIAYNPVPPITTLTAFENFVNDNNLSPAPTSVPPVWTNFYQAYPQTVKQILAS
jgi:hypothetical protein